MRILHYTLGLYPNRTGGLNRYATDLIREQSLEHDVAILMPGPWKPWRDKCCISTGKVEEGLKCFKLINALPQPLFYGIKNPRRFFEGSISKKSFEQFYEEVNPDVLHLHTLMGFPEEALRFFKNKGVKVVFTTHDYFGICPKVNFINSEAKLCEGPSEERCSQCNLKSPSIIYLRLRNSSVMLKIRNVVRWLRTSRHC